MPTVANYAKGGKDPPQHMAFAIAAGLAYLTEYKKLSKVDFGSKQQISNCIGSQMEQRGLLRQPVADGFVGMVAHEYAQIITQGMKIALKIHMGENSHQ